MLVGGVYLHLLGIGDLPARSRYSSDVLGGSGITLCRCACLLLQILQCFIYLLVHDLSIGILGWLDHEFVTWALGWDQTTTTRLVVLWLAIGTLTAHRSLELIVMLSLLSQILLLNVALCWQSLTRHHLLTAHDLLVKAMVAFLPACFLETVNVLIEVGICGRRNGSWLLELNISVSNWHLSFHNYLKIKMWLSFALTDRLVVQALII